MIAAQANLLDFGGENGEQKQILPQRIAIKHYEEMRLIRRQLARLSGGISVFLIGVPAKPMKGGCSALQRRGQRAGATEQGCISEARPRVGGWLVGAWKAPRSLSLPPIRGVNRQVPLRWPSRKFHHRHDARPLLGDMLPVHLVP